MQTPLELTSDVESILCHSAAQHGEHCASLDIGRLGAHPHFTSGSCGGKTWKEEDQEDSTVQYGVPNASDSKHLRASLNLSFSRRHSPPVAARHAWSHEWKASGAKRLLSGTIQCVQQCPPYHSPVLKTTGIS